MLPATLREYAHCDDVVVRFSPHADTFNKRCGILKVYFDQYLKVCASVKTNIRYLRYFYSHVQAEVYFQTDEGLRTDCEMTLMLMNATTPIERGAILESASAQHWIGGGAQHCIGGGAS